MSARLGRGRAIQAIEATLAGVPGWQALSEAQKREIRFQWAQEFIKECRAGAFAFACLIRKRGDLWLVVDGVYLAREGDVLRDGRLVGVGDEMFTGTWDVASMERACDYFNRRR